MSSMTRISAVVSRCGDVRGQDGWSSSSHRILAWRVADSFAPALAFTDLKFSNSMIEAWWRSLKHQWLFLHPLDSVATVRRLVAFYVHEHNTVLPQSAFRGQTPDEMYFGTGDAVPDELAFRATAARHARQEVNPAAARGTCRSVHAAA